MRAVIQRVTRAKVTVRDETVGEIGPGVVVLLGVAHDDGDTDIDWMVRKIRDLRIMAGETSVAELGAPALVISQFTLYGDARKGRRPTWQAAAPGPVAQPVYDALCDQLAATGTEVARGRFGEDMQVELVNDGPFTILLDSPQ